VTVLGSEPIHGSDGSRDSTGVHRQAIRRVSTPAQSMERAQDRASSPVAFPTDRLVGNRTVGREEAVHSLGNGGERPPVAPCHPPALSRP
jgi:hypothetical protein